MIVKRYNYRKTWPGNTTWHGKRYCFQINGGWTWNTNGVFFSNVVLKSRLLLMIDMILGRLAQWEIKADCTPWMVLPKNYAVALKALKTMPAQSHWTLTWDEISRYLENAALGCAKLWNTWATEVNSLLVCMRFTLRWTRTSIKPLVLKHYLLLS